MGCCSITMLVLVHAYCTMVLPLRHGRPQQKPSTSSTVIHTVIRMWCSSMQTAGVHIHTPGGGRVPQVRMSKTQGEPLDMCPKEKMSKNFVMRLEELVVIISRGRLERKNFPRLQKCQEPGTSKENSSARGFFFFFSVRNILFVSLRHCNVRKPCPTTTDGSVRLEHSPSASTPAVNILAAEGTRPQRVSREAYVLRSSGRSSP